MSKPTTTPSRAPVIPRAFNVYGVTFDHQAKAILCTMDPVEAKDTYLTIVRNQGRHGKTQFRQIWFQASTDTKRGSRSFPNPESTLAHEQRVQLVQLREAHQEAETVLADKQKAKVTTDATLRDLALQLKQAKGTFAQAKSAGEKDAANAEVNRLQEAHDSAKAANDQATRELASAEKTAKDAAQAVGKV